MTPLGARVILRKPPVSDKIGSLYIPERLRAMPQEGTVVAIGPLVTTLEVGQQVLFGKYSTLAIPGSSDLVIGWERDVMAVLTND